MKNIIRVSAAILTMGISQAAFAECPKPIVPIIPDGNSATKAEITQAYRDFKNRFQPSIRRYQDCINEERAAVGDIASEDQKQRWTELFDAAFVLESQMANNMNIAIRAFKARKDSETQTAEDKPAQ